MPQGRFRALISIAAALALSSQVALAQIEPSVPEEPSTQEEPLDQVTVEGAQPGPGLWKVSNGPRVLWILGTISSYPKGMTWRPEQIESVIAQSKQILGGANVSANVSRLRALFMLRSILKARFNQDGAVLRDLLEPAVYTRWLDLRQQYFKDDEDIEKVRPMFIAFILYQKAAQRAGLTERSATADVLGKLAKKHRVPIKTREIKVDVGKPRDALEQFNATPREQDVACLVAAIDRIDSDIEAMRRRANAWAVGDLETLRQIPEPVQESLCVNAVTSAPGLQEKFDDARKEVEATWLASAEYALATDDVTLAVLPMAELLSASNRLDKLRAKGYSV